MSTTNVNKHEYLIPDGVYHFYNRANGSERLYLNAGNYVYFLRKYQEYISPLADTFCYCLMPNHFHFLIRIKDEASLKRYFIEKKTKDEKERLNGKENLENLKNPTGFQNLSDLDFQNFQELDKLISKQFSNFFNAYSKAFNKQHNRKGSLFMRPFKRIKVENDGYLYHLVKYIHLNPVEAKICKSPSDWKYSSYASFLNQQATFICKKEVLEWFEDIENFKFFHLKGISEVEKERFTSFDNL